MIFQRNIEQIVKKRMKESSKVIAIYGARQVGKTTLSKSLLSEYTTNDIITLNGDIISDREIFDFTHGQSVEKFVGNKKILFIDEAQRFDNIGLNLKILYDRQLPIHILITGSSSLDITNKIHEPMTGRILSRHLYPISVQEMIGAYDRIQTQKMISNLLIYGSYPDIILADNQQAEKKLKELASNYLYKDVLEYAGMRKPEVLIKLLKLLAFQIGSEVSYHELGQQLGINRETVERYITLLEQSFIIYRLSSWSTNLRNEIKKGVKIYFRDLGIRNALINNFNTLEYRDDIGPLRENFVISERAKYINNNEMREQLYFRRNHQQQEIDLVEQKDNHLNAFEIKRNDRKKSKNHAPLIGAHDTKVITPQNIMDFLT